MATEERGGSRISCGLRKMGEFGSPQVGMELSPVRLLYGCFSLHNIKSATHKKTGSFMCHTCTHNSLGLWF